jgi:hypothetical protein
MLSECKGQERLSRKCRNGLIPLWPAVVANDFWAMVHRHAGEVRWAAMHGLPAVPARPTEKRTRPNVLPRITLRA